MTDSSKNKSDTPPFELLAWADASEDDIHRLYDALAGIPSPSARSVESIASAGQVSDALSQAVCSIPSLAQWVGVGNTAAAAPADDGDSASNDTSNQAGAGAVNEAAASVRSAALLNLVAQTVGWAHERKWTPEKASTLLSIVRRTHDFGMETPHRDVFATFERFKLLLERHNMQRPGYSEGVFTLDESSDALEYMLRTYFRHFLLYKYTFTPAAQIDLRVC
eukprot:m.15115 g.15115  ORF g.15115 m.15115 type:complete len:222 (+) comp3230_c0_seq2:11-676(+)